MNGSDFLKSIQPDVSRSAALDTSNQKVSSERQQRLADLKARVQAGTYTVDIQALSKGILQSGALAND